MYQPTTRLLTVLELLQARGRMSGPELAERLEVDRRSIRRYVVMLQDLGIPIEGVRGRAGGYRLRPGYKLPPLMFSDQEAVVLTLALIAAPRLGLAVDPVATTGALAKLERVLPIAARERVQAVQRAIALDPLGFEGGAGSDVVGLLGEAAERGLQVRMRYLSGAGRGTERVVDPYGVVNIGRRWYLAAFCHLRADNRTFRIDRIAGAEQLETRFARNPDVNPLSLVLASLNSIPGAHAVELLIHAPLSRAKRVIGPGMGVLEEVGPTTTRYRTQVDDLDDLAHFLIGTNLPLTIVNPPAMRDTFRRIARELVAVADAG